MECLQSDNIRISAKIQNKLENKAYLLACSQLGWSLIHISVNFFNVACLACLTHHMPPLQAVKTQHKL